MHYIKEIFAKKKISEDTHSKFIRYSRGVFKGTLFKVKIGKKNFKISASFHIVDELLKLIGKEIKDDKVEIKGVVVWNKDLEYEFNNLGISYEKRGKARGIFKYQVNTIVPFQSYVKAMSKYNLLLNYKISNDFNFSTKTAFPKPNKEIENNFCKCTLPLNLLEKVLDQFAFDVKDISCCKIIEIINILNVEDIEVPDIEDFEMARRLAKRVGRIDRTVIINEEEPIKTSCEFKV